MIQHVSTARGARTTGIRRGPAAAIQRAPRGQRPTGRQAYTMPGRATRGGVSRGTMLAPGAQLGFSLRPPKKVRKAFTAVKKAVTIKNVLKAGAVVGAVLAAPVVLPALASGAAAAGGAIVHGVASGAGLLARGVGAGARILGGSAAGLVRRKPFDKNNPPTTGSSIAADVVDLLKQSGSPASTPAAPPVVPPLATSTNPQDYGGTAPTTYGGGGGGTGSPMPPTPSTADDGTTPSTAGPGPGSAVVPLVIGGLALFALAKSTPKMRRA